MLRTLNNYIVSPSGVDEYPASLASGFIHDRRFLRLLAASVIGHLLFYAVIVKLDVWVKHRWGGGGQRTELVKVIDVAPPPESLTEPRRAPDPIDRADFSRLQFDPEQGDDFNLVSRSPKPALARGTAASSSTSQVEANPKEKRGPGRSGLEGSERRTPPATQPLVVGAIPKPEMPVIVQPSVPQGAAPSPIQSAKPASSGAASESKLAAQGSPQGEGPESAMLGLQIVRAQYMAYVRAKIRQINEKIMPRTWIAEVLNKKVSADFEVRLDHVGRLLSARKVRSTGYPRLDDVANDAIYMASPFEGFPPDAGDLITLTVTVYYTPWQ